MFTMLVDKRRHLANLAADLNKNYATVFRSQVLQLVYFVVCQFALVGINTLLFIVEVPLHFRFRTTDLFTASARRNDQNVFLESYTGFVRRSKLSFVTVAIGCLIIVSQFALAGYSVYRIGKPTKVEALSGTLTLNPAFDATGRHPKTNQYNPDTDGCELLSESFSCDNSSLTTLEQGSNPVVLCDNTQIDVVNTTDYASVMRFSLASVPVGATITSVQLKLNVTVAGSNISIGRPSTDSPETSYATCTTPGASLYEYASNFSQTYLTNQSWTTTGLKTYTLPAAALTDIHNRIGGSIAIAVKGGPRNTIGTYNSTDSSTNKPILTITYTAPPEAPTGTTHGAVTTSSIVWNWTDNATVETRYDVKDENQTLISMCSNLPANTQTCTETGLANANTLYTRHPNVTDAQGSTNGPSASVYTAIETPTEVTKVSATTTAVSVHANGTLTNLGVGQAALYFLDTTTNGNSGWITSANWTESSLVTNSLHDIEVKARNSEGVETSYTDVFNISTNAGAPSVTSSQSPNTWYNSSSFTFSDTTTNGALAHVWDQSPTHAFADPQMFATGPSPFTVTATSEGSWYLHLASYDKGNHPSGGTADLGPFKFDGTPPTTPGAVYDGTEIGIDGSFTTSTTTLSANWTASTDMLSTVAKYQYAIGTTSGGTDVTNNGWLDGTGSPTATKDGLSLTNGVPYYFSVRAVDGAGNTSGVATSNGITVNTALPQITDNQTGDSTPRNVAGTTYNVDFSKAATGPLLHVAQYEVYSGSNKTGTPIQSWTNIFSTDTSSYTTDWSVDFSALAEGTNYVSVQVQALDGLTASLDDAFIIIKDTTSPQITSFVAAPTSSTAKLAWTTNEPSTTQVAYGVTSSYGSLTTLDPGLSTSHSVDLNGLANNTTFHAQALGTDRAGNSVASSDLQFMTQGGSHTYITNVQVALTSPTAVSVTWLTNEPATSKVRYGASTDYGLEVSDLTLVTNHAVPLTGLTAGQTYHYEVMSTGSTTDQDADATFGTTVPAVSVPAVTPSVVVPSSSVVTPTITNWHNGDATADTTPTIAGTGPDSGGVFIVVDRKLVRTVLADVAGKYVVDLLTPLSLGKHALVVRAKDVNGNVSEESQPITITVVTPGNPTKILWRTISDGIHPTITFGAIAPAHATVDIYLDTTIVKTITTPSTSTGAFGFSTTITPSSSVSVGQHTITFVTHNSSGSVSVPTGQTIFIKTETEIFEPAVMQYNQPTTYIVQPGDSLWSIAQHVLGNGRRWTELRQANLKNQPTLQSAPNIIRQGWRLNIPAA